MSLLMAVLAMLGPARDQRRVEQVLAGHAGETDALVEQLMPAIQRRVAWVLSRFGGDARRSDVLDYPQVGGRSDPERRSRAQGIGR